jgi:hypothetical protein
VGRTLGWVRPSDVICQRAEGAHQVNCVDSPLRRFAQVSLLHPYDGMSFICWSRTRIAAGVTPNSFASFTRSSRLNSPSAGRSCEIANQRLRISKNLMDALPRQQVEFIDELVLPRGGTLHSKCTCTALRSVRRRAVAAPLASAVLAFEPFSKTGMASADLMLLSHPPALVVATWGLVAVSGWFLREPRSSLSAKLNGSG